MHKNVAFIFSQIKFCFYYNYKKMIFIISIVIKMAFMNAYCILNFIIDCNLVINDG